MISITNAILECKDAGRIRARDSHVTTVLRGRLELSIVKSGKDFEIFSNGRWHMNQSPCDYEDRVLKELREVFGTFHYDELLDRTRVTVREPFENNGFASSMANTIVKRIGDSDQAPLDANNHWLLLDQKGRLLDFKTNQIRTAVATDRLFRHVPHDLQEWPHQAIMDQFASMLCSLFKRGCVDLNSEDADEFRTFYNELVKDERFEMLQSLHGVSEDVNNVVYFVRVLACAVIGIPELVQLFGLTGPVNCAKSYLSLLLAGSLGQGPSNLLQALPANWLTGAVREDAESSIEWWSSEDFSSQHCPVKIKEGLHWGVLRSFDLHPTACSALLALSQVVWSGGCCGCRG